MGERGLPHRCHSKQCRAFSVGPARDGLRKGHAKHPTGWSGGARRDISTPLQTEVPGLCRLCGPRGPQTSQSQHGIDASLRPRPSRPRCQRAWMTHLCTLSMAPEPMCAEPLGSGSKKRCLGTSRMTSSPVSGTSSMAFPRNLLISLWCSAGRCHLTGMPPVTCPWMSEGAILCYSGSRGIEPSAPEVCCARFCH